MSSMEFVNESLLEHMYVMRKMRKGPLRLSTCAPLQLEYAISQLCAIPRSGGTGEIVESAPPSV